MDQHCETINRKNIESITYAEYEIITKKIVRYLNGKYASVIHFLNALSDEEILHDLTHEVMMADWRWDESKKTNLRTYRFHRVRWRLMKLLSTKQRLMANEVSLPDKIILEITDKPQRQTNQPHHNFDIQEYIDQHCHLLTDKQKLYLVEYYAHGKTMEAIATKYEVSRQAINCGISNGLRKIRKYGKAA